MTEADQDPLIHVRLGGTNRASQVTRAQARSANAAARSFESRLLETNLLNLNIKSLHRGSTRPHHPVHPQDRRSADDKIGRNLPASRCCHEFASTGVVTMHHGPHQSQKCR